MRSSDKEGSTIEFTEQFKKRALELLDETQAIQFAEGLRLNSASTVVFNRELKRLSQKYGDDDRRTKEMAVRLEASTEANKTLFARFVEATTPPPDTAEKGWAVDGFVRASTGAPVPGLTVAIYDSKEMKIREFGQSTTDDRGHFSIKAEKRPDDLAVPVFVRASKGTRVLPSNEVRLEPAPGRTER